jgi:hypothetical protein
MTEPTLFDDLPTFEPLKVSCGDTDCDKDKHCFRPNRRKKDWQKTYQGACQDCGKQLVDWDRIKGRDLKDVARTFGDLQHEYIRHVFFCAPFDEASVTQAARLGVEGLRARVRPLLASKIGPEKIFRDGTQTRKEGSAIHYAQHATATCCRKCLEYWHGIERGHELTPAELDYCEGLVQAYLDLREPALLDAVAALGDPPS